jgi:hypothetical protein
MDLPIVYRIFHVATSQYTFFSAAHGTVYKIDYILGYKASLRKYKKIEISPCILSDHNAIKVELNHKSNSRKCSNSWRVNNTLLNYQWVIGEIREEIKKFLEVNENGNTSYQNPWDTAKPVLRGKFMSMSAYIIRTEGSQINNLMLHLKYLEKQEQAECKTNKREIIKVLAKINEVEANPGKKIGGPHVNK